ncbi:MAG: 3-phosphoshikimate 1-carboxyvinyltransferase [Bacteroidales bacterium]|nr:3-phosphoshikimate 1-carboxyvinyltransferase [Bacteroidales bacterium]
MNTGDIQITLPPSKSLSNRWLVVNHFMGDTFVLRNLSTSDDTVLLRRLLRQLRSGTSSVFYCDNAGTVARFLLAILAVSRGSFVLSGDDSLRQRPIADLVTALRSMGLKIEYTDDEERLPVQIDGCEPLRKMVSIRATQSSQFASALMLIGLSMPSGISVSLVGRIASRPYIDMTAHVIRQAGVEVSVSVNGHTYMVGSCGTTGAKQRTVVIENDWSSASYFYTMAALMPQLRIRLRNLSLDSCQGDKIVSAIFAQMGVATQSVRSPYRAATRSLVISSSGNCEKRLRQSFIDCPDLLPTVAVACAAKGIDAQLRGIRNLRLKESDRINAIVTELGRMGAKIDLSDDVMHIHPSTLHAVERISTYADHRIVMAFAPLLLIYPDMEIENPGLVSKSFPDFWNQFDQVRKCATTSVLS